MYLKKIVSGIVLTALLINQGQTSLHAQSEVLKSSRVSIPAGDMLQAKLPKNLGTIQDVFKGKSGRKVLILQDAHSIPEAQENLRQILDKAQKEYGVTLTALEGASGVLDAQIFKSFPDQEALRTVLAEYSAKGELPAGAAAAILNETSAIYAGLEDPRLYEQGVTFYLEALKNQTDIAKKISNLEKKLAQEKEIAYSAGLLKVDRELENFYSAERSLVDALKALAQVKPPEKGSMLEPAVQEILRENSSVHEDEIRSLASQVEKALQSKGQARKLAEFNGKYQSYKVSHASPEIFAAYLAAQAEESGITLRLSPALLASLESQKKIQSVEGTRFFKEFETYAEKVKGSLLKNAEQRALESASIRLRLLKKMNKLEMSFEGWKQFSSMVWSKDENEILGMLDNHKRFYETAERRDALFLKHLESLMRKHSGEPAAVIVGGFHAEGLTRHFRENGISYVMITPSISQVPEVSIYSEHMKGNVSWKKYFRAENGRVNLYEAFVRSVRDQLLEGMGYGVLGMEKSKPYTLNPATLKAWRDQLIRDLSAQKRIADLNDYTRFLDELKGPAEDSVLAAWKENIHRIVTGMTKLEQNGALNEANLSQLFKAAHNIAPAASPFILSPPESISEGTLAMSEARLPAGSESILSESVKSEAQQGSIVLSDEAQTLMRALLEKAHRSPLSDRLSLTPEANKLAGTIDSENRTSFAKEFRDLIQELYDNRPRLVSDSFRKVESLNKLLTNYQIKPKLIDITRDFEFHPVREFNLSSGEGLVVSLPEHFYSWSDLGSKYSGKMKALPRALSLLFYGSEENPYFPTKMRIEGYHDNRYFLLIRPYGRGYDGPSFSSFGGLRATAHFDLLSDEIAKTMTFGPEDGDFIQVWQSLPEPNSSTVTVTVQAPDGAKIYTKTEWREKYYPEIQSLIVGLFSERRAMVKQAASALVTLAGVESEIEINHVDDVLKDLRFDLSKEPGNTQIKLIDAVIELRRLARSEARQLKFGIDPEFLAQNRSKMVPIFISGGEGPGVNDYFSYVARELRRLELIPVAVKSGIKGFVQNNFADQLFIIDEETEKTFLGMGGSLAGTSRVNLLDAKKPEDLKQALENMKGFHSYLAIGGGDHAVFWTKFERAMDDNKELDAALRETGKEIVSKMLVVYKTIDGDTHGQPLGIDSSAGHAQRIIYSVAASGDAMEKTSVMGIMGADVGRLAVLSASRNPQNLDLLKKSRRTHDDALARQIELFRDQVMILIPEIPVPLSDIVEAVDQKRSAVVVVSEGFAVEEDDPMLQKLITPQSSDYDEDAVWAWNKYLSAPRDAHGNVKRADTSVEYIVGAAIKRFAKKKDIRMAEKIGFGTLRGANPDLYDRLYARLLAAKAASLIITEKFGNVVSLGTDDRSIGAALNDYLSNPSLQKTSAEDYVFQRVKSENPFQIQSFRDVRQVREEKGLFNALQAWSMQELRDAGVVMPTRSEARAISTTRGLNRFAPGELLVLAEKTFDENLASAKSELRMPDEAEELGFASEEPKKPAGSGASLPQPPDSQPNTETDFVEPAAMTKALEPLRHIMQQAQIIADNIRGDVALANRYYDLRNRGYNLVLSLKRGSAEDAKTKVSEFVEGNKKLLAEAPLRKNKSELRKAPAVTPIGSDSLLGPQSLAAAAYPGNPTVFRANVLAGAVISSFQVLGADKFKKAALAEAEALQAKAFDQILNDLAETGHTESLVTVAAVFPEKPDHSLLPIFARGFAKAFRQGEVSDFLKQGARFDAETQAQFTARGMQPRKIRVSRKQLVAEETQQGAVPAALVGAYKGAIADMFLPVEITDIEKLSNDPRSLEFLGLLTGRALKAQAAALQENPGLKFQPEKLKEEVLRQLWIQGFDGLQMNNGTHPNSFSISALTAKAVLDALVSRAIARSA